LLLLLILFHFILCIVRRLGSLLFLSTAIKAMETSIASLRASYYVHRRVWVWVDGKCWHEVCLQPAILWRSVIVFHHVVQVVVKFPVFWWLDRTYRRGNFPMSVRFQLIRLIPGLLLLVLLEILNEIKIRQFMLILFFSFCQYFFEVHYKLFIAF